MEAKFPKRKTAYRFWIKDIINAIPISQEGIHLFEIRGKEALRVNIIAAVVNKQTNEEKTYSTITLDDGTETIRVKTWREDIKQLEGVNIGDPVMVVGKIRFYGNELSIMPEIVKKQEPEWLQVRKQELEKHYGKPEEKGQEIEKEEPEQKEEEKPSAIVEEEVVNEPTQTARQKILEIVENETSQEGAQISQVVQRSGLKEEEAEKAIDELLKEGELFQPRTGFLKVI